MNTHADHSFQFQYNIAKFSAKSNVLIEHSVTFGLFHYDTILVSAQGKL